MGPKREYLVLNLLAKAVQNGERHYHNGNAQGNADGGDARNGMGKGAGVGPIHAARYVAGDIHEWRKATAAPGLRGGRPGASYAAGYF